MSRNPVFTSVPQSGRTIPRGRTAAAIALAGGLIASLGACASGDTTSTEQGPASTEIPSDPVEITMWTVQTGAAQDSLQGLIDAYEAENPNVTINLDYTESAAFSSTFKLVMSSDTAPDIIECGQGYTQMGPLVQSNLIISLEPYDELYGWSDRIAEGFLGPSRMSDDGASFGSGTLFGLPIAGNMIGIYYNVEKVDALGIDLDFQTVDDFTDALETAKAGGEVPIMFGNLDGDPGAKAWEPLMSAYQEKQVKRDWITGVEGSNIQNPEAIEATQQLLDWSDAGYIYEGAAGTSRADGNALYTGGEGVFALTGSWYLGTYTEAMGENVGYTLFPRVNAGDPAQASGATSQPWCISSKSDYPDVAANFLDFTAQAENAQILWDGGFLPLVGAEDVVSPNTGSEQALEAWNTLVEQDGLTLHSDWATPSMQRTENPGLQEVLAGRLSPEDFLGTMQQNWEDFQATK